MPDPNREMFLLLTTASNEGDVKQLAQSLVSAGGVSSLNDTVASLRQSMVQRAGGAGARVEDLTALAVTL